MQIIYIWEMFVNELLGARLTSTGGRSCGLEKELPEANGIIQRQKPTEMALKSRDVAERAEMWLKKRRCG